MIFLVGSIDVFIEDISVFFLESNMIISVYIYSLLGGILSNILVMDEYFVNRFK